MRWEQQSGWREMIEDDRHFEGDDERGSPRQWKRKQVYDERGQDMDEGR